MESNTSPHLFTYSLTPAEHIFYYLITSINSFLTSILKGIFRRVKGQKYLFWV
jgi:hypothetical protein